MCQYKLKDYGSGQYETECGHTVMPSFLSPDDYQLNYCMICGEKVEVDDSETKPTEKD